MNIHTPIFRGALTIAILWIAICGYLFVNEYRSEIERLGFSGYITPDYLTDNCYAQKFDFEAERLREPTEDERQSCLNIAQGSHAESIASSKKFVTEQAWKGFAFKGALPALALLAIVAFWHSIINGFSRVGSAYMSWLRFGSSGSPEDKDGQ